MHRLIIFFALAVLLGGCGSSGRIGALPAVSDPARAGTIIVIRPSHLVSAANAFTIAVDKRDVLRIGSGEHARFRLPSGSATVAVKCFGGWSPTWKEQSVGVTIPAGGVVYLKVAPDMSCASIQEVPAGTGASLVAETSPIDLGASASR